MKRYLPLILTSLFFASPAWAGGPPKTVAASEHAVDVAMTLTVRLPTLPDSPSFSAGGAGKLEYKLTGAAAVIKGESIPRLVFESQEPLGGMKKPSVVVEALPGTSPTVDWSAFPKIVLRQVDLRVRLYDAPMEEIGESARPTLDTILQDLVFSTDRVEVEGEESKGYVDADGPEVLLVGKTVLPEDPFPPYAEWLSGEQVILELKVGMVNPYGR